MVRYASVLLYSVLTILLLESDSQSTGITKQIETGAGRFYNIEAFDGAVLTIGGDNSRGVRVITETLHGSDPRQKFVVLPGNTHEIKPQAQNSYSSLLLDLDVQSKLLFQQWRFYRRNQWFTITPLDNGRYAIQDNSIKHCLVSEGKNTQVRGTICNSSAANQTWAFVPALRAGTGEDLMI